ncbi:hypothetical protein GO013_01520 [Pseudodesulfovibrio sp. JC047]|uniref:hypothetical protein n=1 Tax=Pseudodesulfovibrio sp. JC047 TaxID=2683199 RepID=UPI0013D57C4A|nr:hypothetical protein [Pseudodesulfovibrio sp. JC047]NDV18096.1 hypothetical protein [Pseudodesulfovibrio sp. JC047]
MTQFRMLPVRCGDAYLLKSGRGAYLVDGGSLAGFLPEMLHERTIGKLRAAICTYPSPERLGGILDLMEERYRVSEYWLPDWLGIMPMLAQVFNHDWEKWFELCDWPLPEELIVGGVAVPSSQQGAWAENAAILVALGVVACSGRFTMGGSTQHILEKSLDVLAEQASGRVVGTPGGVRQTLQILGRGFRDWGSTEENVLLCGRLLYHAAMAMTGNETKPQKNVTMGLAMAVMGIALTAGVETKIRYFRQTGQLENSLVARHPFKIVNGIEITSWETVPKTVSPETLFSAASRPFGRGKGLVLRYGDAECGALFCGDTTLSFLNKNNALLLNQPTVIAAPRQGGISADHAYKYILSVNPENNIWVRSHYSYACKVSNSFKKSPNKMCLNNCVHRTVQEVLLAFSDTRWDWLAGGGCICD